MKQCSKCKQIFPLDNFHAREHTSIYTGKVKIYYGSYCKSCNTLLALERRQSVKGMYQDIYNGQIGSSKQRKHALPNYTFEELVTWIDSQPNAKELIQAWVDSGYVKNLKPSCDRLDDYLPYTLDNLQLTTWEANALKAKKDIREGTNNKQNKAVIQFTKEGVFIAQFHSIQEASRQTGCAAGNLLRCCTGKYKSSKGFKWKYAN